MREPHTAGGTEGTATGEPGHPSAEKGQVFGLAATFFLLFLGAGAFQQFLAQSLPGGAERAKLLRTTILAVLYGSFLLWRVGVAWTARWLGEWGSILVGALCYGLVPVLIAVGAPPWSLVVAAGVWGFGAASLWVASGTRVLRLSARNRHGRATAAIYVGTLTGLALGLVVQSLLARRWGPGVLPGWAAGLSLAAAAVAAGLRRGAPPQERPTWSRYRSLLLDPHILLAGMMLFASGLTYPVLLSTFGDEVVRRASVAALGLVVVWFHVAKAALSYAGGWASDRWGRGRALSVGFLGGAAGLVLAGLVSGTGGLAVAAFCLGIPSGVVPVVATAMVGDRVKGPRRMMALGSLFVWRDGAVVLGLAAGEVLRRALNLAGSFFVLAAVLVAFAIVSRGLGWKDPATTEEPGGAEPAEGSGRSGRRPGDHPGTNPAVTPGAGGEEAGG